MVQGKSSGSEGLAKHIFDCEEGNAVEHVIMNNQ